MGFDLCAKKRKVEDFNFGAHGWHWMLGAGVGLPLGYGPGLKEGTFIYREGKCIGANDGVFITSNEAKTMAMIARWVADYQDSLNYHFEKLSMGERLDMINEKDILKSNKYNPPVQNDLIECVRAFADWAERSGGFYIN
jgi:hypothetical protein